MRSLFALVLCATALSFAPQLGAQNLSGRRAPSFSMPDSKLVQHDILDSRGKWLLMEYIEVKCPYCKDLSKSLEALHVKYAGKLDIYAVVVPPENQQTVAGYIAETKINFPILFDSSQTAIAFFKATPQNPSFDTPHLFAIDPNGQIAKDWSQASAKDPKLMAILLKDLETMIAGSGNGKK